MADIRINALATTAASTASDDFIAVDGSANGTRKLNAYSPTFGGNLTVSGAAAINGGNAVYGGGAVLLGGSGGGSGNAVYTTDTGSPTIYTDHRGTSNTGDWYWRNGTGGANTRMILSGAGNLTVSGGTVTSGTGTLTLNSSANTVVLQSAGTTALTLDSSQNATFAGSIAINNTVQTAVSVASTHKVTISIGGSTYYLLATNV